MTWIDEREPTPNMYCVPKRIERHEHGWAIVHGPNENMLAVKSSITGCMLLILEWKRRGMCESWHIDNLFIFDAIEW